MSVEQPAAPAVAAARGAGRRALLVTVVAVLMLVPWPLPALVVGVLAFVLAVRAFVAAGRAGSRRRVAIVAMSVSPVVVLLAGLLSLSQLVFGDQIARYEECMRGANTHTSRDQCQQELRRDIGRTFGLRIA